MAAQAEAFITAGIKPELFAERGLVSVSRNVLIATLMMLVVVGFGLRVLNLSSEGLSEDELNKLQAVADYRQNGLTSANSEHPFLMKALLTGSMVLADKWNSVSFFGGHRQIPPETALRIPGTVFGALTAILIYLIAAELFGAEVGLIAAALWAFDPMAIGFNRIAKEDTFLLFFFLLANVFWLRGQRVAESSDQQSEKYYWATAAAFGAMMASKYLPQLLTISMGYYWLFQRIPETRWRLGKKRMLIMLVIMSVVFVVLNPTILFPATWRQMSQFAGQKLIGHDAYEFMGQLYSHRMTDWLKGIPWYFYHVFVAVKLPLLTVVGFVVGLPLLFRRQFGDGRYFIMLWLFLWMMTFSFTGGKFTRYFTVALPAVLITSAIGVQFASNWIARRLSSLLSADRGPRAGSPLGVVEWPKLYLRAALVLLVIATAFKAAVDAAPHFRLHTNALGGGPAKQGYYFPHDEFYDASMRDAIFEIAKRAKPGARVASESISLASYYAQRANRPDLVCVLLSDPAALQQLREGDFVIDAPGRRYFSNELVTSKLKQSSTPAFRVSLGDVPSASVYLLDKSSAEAVVEASRRRPPLAKRVNPVLVSPAATQ